MHRKTFIQNALMGISGMSLVGMPGSKLFNQENRNYYNKNSPNILLFLADDMTYHDLGVLGNQQLQTPNLDRLASEGILLSHSFCSSPMCAPCRMSLYTGIHPVRNGAHPNHSRVYSHIKSMPHYLRDLGYRVALIGKQHEAPEENFPFKVLGGRHHDSGTNIDLELEIVRKFLEENKTSLWSLVVSSNQPHRPWNRGKTYLYPPEDLELPPYLVDTPETRQELARYYAEITYMDQQVGQVMQYLAETGQEDNTIVIFLSEQGSNFPHCKWTCYDTGVRSAGIVRWPGVIQPGRESDVLIQYVDVLPTLIEAVSGTPEDHDFDGKSFLSILTGEKTTHNEYAFSIQTSKGIYSGPDAYGIRSVRSKNFRLIWNLNWESEFQNTVISGFDPYLSWKRKAEKGDPFAAKRFSSYKKRPEFELYDLRYDPYELHNLAKDPFYQSVYERLKKVLENWMAQQGDQGTETERNALNRQSDRWMN